MLPALPSVVTVVTEQRPVADNLSADGPWLGHNSIGTRLDRTLHCITLWMET